MKNPVFEKGFFPVSDNHKLYYERYGNPNGIPVVFVHGGPGAGFTAKHRKFFNPNRFNVLFYDQRGASKSRPFAVLKDNNTWKLVEDMKKLIDNFFGRKVYLVGGSWGSTLALVYAISHPETVKGMVLRGIYLATKEENEFYTEGGVGLFFPDVWERFNKLVPKHRRKDAVKFFDEQIQSKNKKIKDKYTFEWSFYELCIARLNLDSVKVREEMKKDPFYKSMSPLETHYIANKCFLPDNFILNNARKIRNMPVSLINGRYDMICPPISAYKLHKLLPKSRLTFTIAGHLQTEKHTRKVMIDEIRRLCV